MSLRILRRWSAPDIDALTILSSIYWVLLQPIACSPKSRVSMYKGLLTHSLLCSKSVELTWDYKIFPDTMSKGKLLTHLKAVGLACGIRTPLGYHVGRHSFGTLTLEAGIPIESIAKMMEHSSIASTQIYAQITDQKISRDMDRLKWEEGMSKFGTPSSFRKITYELLHMTFTEYYLWDES